jgi:hypothetical protein
VPPDRVPRDRTTPGTALAAARHRTAVAALDLPVPAERVWDVVADVRNHDRWIPLTRVDAAPALGVGDTFVAVTGPGAARGGGGLRDTMTVTRSDPPTATTAGVGVYRKTGPVLLGEATVHVRPTGPTSCALIWTEDVHLRGLPRALTAPLLRPFTAAMLHRALRAVRAELARP